jgi:hypothetical protein
LNRAKKDGVKLGRPFGSKDKGRRRRSGYYNRWNKDKQSIPVKMSLISS